MTDLHEIQMQADVLAQTTTILTLTTLRVIYQVVDMRMVQAGVTIQHQEFALKAVRKMTGLLDVAEHYNDFAVCRWSAPVSWLCPSVVP